MDVKKKVLVTGITGFIGSNLAERLLAAGHEVVGIDNLAYGIPENIPAGATLHKADVRSADIYPFFEGVDAVFHFAAKNDLIACQEDPVDTIQINVGGTVNVLEAARRAGVKKVVFASSSALEEGEARLNGFYAISKIAGEKIVAGYRAGFGLNVTIVRYFNVYGPRQDYRRVHPPVMSAFIIKMLKGEAPVLYEGYDENKRDFIYVDDLNDFQLQCVVDDRVNDQLFRIGSGKNHSMKEVLETIQKMLGTNVRPVIKPRTASDNVVATLADISAAKALGWQPKTSLEEGLRKQIAYLKGEFAKGNIK